MEAVKDRLLIDSEIPWTTSFIMVQSIKLVGNSRVQAEKKNGGGQA